MTKISEGNPCCKIYHDFHMPHLTSAELNERF